MASTTTVIHSARRVTPEGVVPDAWVAFTGDTITARGSGDSWRSSETAADAGTVIDAGNALLTPGFIDIHCHGAAGHNFDDGPGGYGPALALHRSHGTTRSLLSLVTNPLAEMLAATREAASRASADELVLGIHLEGPFLSHSHKGAHDENSLITPTPEAIDLLLEAAAGQLRQVTLAPELPGAREAIRQLVARGVAVAVGHSDADYETTAAACEAGASILTHAFNGMNGIHHRAPGPVVAALDRESVILEVIADGVHVRPEIIGLLFAQAPDRVALVSDAMAATGNPDGDYRLGALEVTVTEGVARLTEGGNIAGSTLTLDRALHQTVRRAGVPVHLAVNALTNVPARALGLGDRYGRVATGYAADILLLDDSFQPVRVWAAGREYAAAVRE
ncbi:N-acetylglucosamine-6-phosphate deacetylase [Klugiella xanthotipulae]|uniref:N-acetylglucosamine 6-phosphate deacetylase n=1 Tax=Klugiella xanthotipulae TaxID=244735 RepID=A0A543I5C5_9MICO|nr:N-acetylglucosamine-6-phosphate deacetylase [Klugiella xanthotipulae]TQM65670.1 N-acetylglucosamine 6-phosphate deacetylase [Klugiella xanthotipulae]